MISQALLDEFEKQVLDPYHEMEYGSFADEVEFIRHTAVELAGTKIRVGNESIEIESEVTHGTPTAIFRSPHSPDGIDAACEIADLLFILELQINGMVQHQRAMLVQAKFEPKNASSDNRYWTVNMRQLELLYRLPEFKIRSPVDYGSFELNPSTKTFTSYSFASTFQLPFYQSADRVFSETNLFNCDFSQKTSRFRPKDYIGFDSSPSVLKRFLMRTIGEDLTESDSDVRRLVESLYDYAANDRSFHALFSDGGTPVATEQFDFAVIKFTVQKEGDASSEHEQVTRTP